MDSLVALHPDPDDVAGLPPPELLVELLLRAHGDAVDAEDAIALAEAGPRGGADRRQAGPHGALPGGPPGEAQPPARPAADDTARRAHVGFVGPGALDV